MSSWTRKQWLYWRFRSQIQREFCAATEWTAPLPRWYQPAMRKEITLTRTADGVALTLLAHGLFENAHEYRFVVPGKEVRAPASAAVGMLRLASRCLPRGQRDDWLEENRGYLCDLPTHRARLAWVLEQVLGMPRYAYTVRTGCEKESA